MHLTSIPAAPVGRALPSFFHPRYVFRVLVCAMTVQGRADPQEKLKGVTEIVAVVAIESIRSIVDGELGAESDVDAAAVRQIVHVTDAVSANGENAGFILWIENQFMTGLFYSLPAQINCVAPALII